MSLIKIRILFALILVSAQPIIHSAVAAATHTAPQVWLLNTDMAHFLLTETREGKGAALALWQAQPEYRPDHAVPYAWLKHLLKNNRDQDPSFISELRDRLIAIINVVHKTRAIQFRIHSPNAELTRMDRIALRLYASTKLILRRGPEGQPFLRPLSKHQAAIYERESLTAEGHSEKIALAEAIEEALFPFDRSSPFQKNRTLKRNREPLDFSVQEEDPKRAKLQAAIVLAKTRALFDSDGVSYSGTKSGSIIIEPIMGLSPLNDLAYTMTRPFGTLSLSYSPYSLLRLHAGAWYQRYGKIVGLPHATPLGSGDMSFLGHEILHAYFDELALAGGDSYFLGGINRNIELTHDGPLLGYAKHMSLEESATFAITLAALAMRLENPNLASSDRGRIMRGLRRYGLIAEAVNLHAIETLTSLIQTLMENAPLQWDFSERLQGSPSYPSLRMRFETGNAIPTEVQIPLLDEEVRALADQMTVSLGSKDSKPWFDIAAQRLRELTLIRLQIMKAVFEEQSEKVVRLNTLLEDDAHSSRLPLIIQAAKEPLKAARPHLQIQPGMPDCHLPFKIFE